MDNIKVIRTLTALAVLILLHPGGVNLEAQNATNILSAAYELEASGNTDSALREAYKALKENETYWFDVSKYIIKLNNRAGLYSENMKLFREGHERGYFYFIHPRMTEYEPYLSIPGFDSVSSTDLMIRNRAIEKSKTLYYVELPDEYDSTVSSPLIFILHGGGGTIQSVRKHWQVPGLNKRFIKVYLQSYRHFDYNTFGWGTGDDRLDEDVRLIINDIFSSYSIDSALVFTGGISAGATAATDLAIRYIVPATGVIAFCPDVPGTLLQKPLPDIPNLSVRVYIWAGENDYFRPRQLILMKMLDSLDVAFRYVVDPGMGHTYPADENHQVIEALKFIHGPDTKSGPDRD